MQAAKWRRASQDRASCSERSTPPSEEGPNSLPQGTPASVSARTVGGTAQHFRRKPTQIHKGDNLLLSSCTAMTHGTTSRPGSSKGTQHSSERELFGSSEPLNQLSSFRNCRFNHHQKENTTGIAQELSADWMNIWALLSSHNFTVLTRLLKKKNFRSISANYSQEWIPRTIQTSIWIENRKLVCWDWI